MTKKPLSIEATRHDAATRKNIPTAEFESIMRTEDKSPIRVAYERRVPFQDAGEVAGRERDLDPQLVWRGKDAQDWSDLVVSAPPLYIQEKVHPKVLIDDLKRETQQRRKEAADRPADLFADFNGLRDKEAATEFYQHDQHWSNRMISGDSLSVMASLAEREGLRGKVQCIYFDPPYGIKFNSNFQWSTSSRDVKDGARDNVTREPEQVRAFRDTWRDGIHSYLTYLRDRLTVARDLLHESGSIFVQIGDENVHRVRALMDEVFGDENFVSQITVRKTTSEGNNLIGSTCDFILWFSKKRELTKSRSIFSVRSEDSESRYSSQYFDGSFFRLDNLTSSRPSGDGDVTRFDWFNQTFNPGKGTFKTTETGLVRLGKADRFQVTKKGKLNYRRSQNDFGFSIMGNLWADISGAVQSRSDPKVYVVQTSTSIVARCILMTTDPGDLVLDPTCGSGTTAYVAEQWGRRWITIDTSRVSLALARARLMGARYPYYLLADSVEGQRKEAEVTRQVPKTTPTRGDIRQGFVYERVPHITLKSIANNAEIDVIWEKWEQQLAPLRAELNKLLGTDWEEWQIPRELPEPFKTTKKTVGVDIGTESLGVAMVTTESHKITFAESQSSKVHSDWWQARIARQTEIDASIAAKAEFEYLYDKPYADNARVRVAGPFTVESLSPHRTLAVGADDELIDLLEASEGARRAEERDGKILDFAQMILENLRAAGVQQAQKADRINFSSVTGWPGHFLCAEGRFMEGDKEKRAGIIIGPEYGTVSRPDLVAAAREAGDAGFDAVIACAFNYDAHSTEFERLGRVPVLKARMNPDLMMAKDLKTTGAGNLFIVFGEPDIKIEDAEDGMIRVKVFGVDVFKPQTGEIVSEGIDGIALWMLDTHYNEESFFVRHAYFLGANDPYKALRTTLKAEVDQEAWDSLYSDISRPFPRPQSGRIAVKVINHLGDEVMKVFGV